MVCRDQVQGTRLHIFHEITDEIFGNVKIVAAYNKQ